MPLTAPARGAPLVEKIAVIRAGTGCSPVETK
jgi:hypothetical protein